MQPRIVSHFILSVVLINLCSCGLRTFDLRPSIDVQVLASYPGAEALQQNQVNDLDEGTYITFLTKDSPEVVLETYRKRLESYQWDIQQIHRDSSTYVDRKGCPWYSVNIHPMRNAIHYTNVDIRFIKGRCNHIDH
jgi:hypothetical protein